MWRPPLKNFLVVDRTRVAVSNTYALGLSVPIKTTPYHEALYISSTHLPIPGLPRSRSECYEGLVLPFDILSIPFDMSPHHPIS